MELTDEQQLETLFRGLFEELPVYKDQWDVLHIDGWDSLLHMVLVSKIEQEFSIRIPPADYLQCTSYEAICKKIKGILR